MFHMTRQRSEVSN